MSLININAWTPADVPGLIGAWESGGIGNIANATFASQYGTALPLSIGGNWNFNGLWLSPLKASSVSLGASARSSQFSTIRQFTVAIACSLSFGTGRTIIQVYDHSGLSAVALELGSPNNIHVYMRKNGTTEWVGAYGPTDTPVSQKNYYLIDFDADLYLGQVWQNQTDSPNASFQDPFYSEYILNTIGLSDSGNFSGLIAGAWFYNRKLTSQEKATVMAQMKKRWPT